MKQRKITAAIINGPNMNMLGKRAPQFYGEKTLEQTENDIAAEAARLSVSVSFFQSSSEGEIVRLLNSAEYDFVILNAAAYSHYSIAVRDAVECCPCPVIEVHISNIYSREEFRNKSVLSAVCAGSISGFGTYGYTLALFAGIRMTENSRHE